MSLSWQVNVDWTTAGTFDTRNDAERMVDYKLVRGRKQFINSNGDGLQAVEPGLLQIKLDNYDGVYDPYNTSSVLYPNVEPGRFIRVKSTTNDAKVLLHMDGADAGTTFTDEMGKTWTAEGGAVTSTAQKKFGTASLKVENTTSYIWTPASDDFWLHDYDWTWDFQIRMSSISGNEIYTLVNQQQDLNNVFTISYTADTTIPHVLGLLLYCKTGGILKWQKFYHVTTPTSTPSTDTWYHLEVCRKGDNLLAFFNGNELIEIDGIGTDMTPGTSIGYIDAPLKIGGAVGGTLYIDEVLFKKGVAEHTAVFTPPSSAYTDFWRDRFCGRIENIDKIGDVYNPQVLITAYDGLKELKEKKVSTAVVEGSTAARVGTQIAYLTTSAEWPSIYGTSSIDAGNGIVEYAWSNEETAFQTIKDLADIEAGLFCARADGSFMFRSREATTASLTLDQAIMRKDILLTSPYKLNRNVAKVYIYDKSTPESSAVKLWKLNDVPLVSTAAGLTVWGRFKYDGNECAGYDMVAPADTTDFKMNNKEDGSGSDRTALWDVTTTYFGEVSKNVISADGASNNHYCILLKNRGKPIVSDESTYKVYDHSGTASERTLTIDSPFIQTSWQADFYDSFIEQLVATTLRFPIFQLEAQPAYQFDFELFEKINVTIAKYGIDGAYLVGGIEEEWLNDNGQAVLTTVYTEPDIIVTEPTTLTGE